MRRRTFAGVIGSIAAGGVGYAALTQETQAVAVQMDGLDVADESIQTSQPVNGAEISVSTSYGWETTTTPTRVVLRLTATYAAETFQLGATEVPGALDPQQSGEHTFEENLLDHPQITAPDLTPQTVGESESLTFTVGVTMSVYGDSGKLGEETIQDTATITVEKQQASVTTTLSGEGSIRISTQTPA